jgi:hypothetical protein
MSFSNALVAARTDRDRLQDAFLTVWDTLRPIERSPEFRTFEELYAWSKLRSRSLGGTDPNEVFAFWQDESWAVMLDFSMCLSADEDRLIRLSGRLGLVAVAVTQGTSGTAMFQLYEGGQLLRGIDSCDGRITSRGEPVPAEAGVNVEAGFYIDEIERVWLALGMTSFWAGDKVPLVALHVLDTTDYSLPAVRPKTRRRPWWKFW